MIKLFDDVGFPSHSGGLQDLLYFCLGSRDDLQRKPVISNRHSHSGIAQQFTKANKDWTSSDGGQLRLYKQRPNPFQLEKGATEPNEDEAPTARGSLKGCQP